MLIGFNINELGDVPEYPEDDNETNYENWLYETEAFAKIEGTRFIRNNFPNIINIEFEKLDDEFVKFYCSVKTI